MKARFVFFGAHARAGAAADADQAGLAQGEVFEVAPLRRPERHTVDRAVEPLDEGAVGIRRQAAVLDRGADGLAGVAQDVGRGLDGACPVALVRLVQILGEQAVEKTLNAADEAKARPWRGWRIAVIARASSCVGTKASGSGAAPEAASR